MIRSHRLAGLLRIGDQTTRATFPEAASTRFVLPQCCGRFREGRNHRVIQSLILTGILLLLAACGPAAPEEPTAIEQPAPAAQAEATATPLPTEAPAPTDTPEPAPAAEEPTATPEPEPDWTQTAFVEGDLYVRGNPDAPIRLIDYSDFF